jgi:hypothetical protein
MQTTRCGLVFFFIFVTFGTVASSQTPQEVQSSINSDRPGQAFTPFTISKNVWQTQNGIGVRPLRDNSLVLSHIVPNAFLRFGLGHRTEINAGFERVGTAGYRKISPFPELPIIKTMSLGLRHRLDIWHNQIRKPALTILVLAHLPYTKFNSKNTVNTSATIIASNKLGKNWTYNINLGVNTDFNNPISTSYVANLGYTIAPKWSIFAENFGNFNNNNFYNYFDAGIAFVPQLDWQIDLYAGNGIGQNLYNGFINAGFSYRLPNKQSREPH